MTLWADLVGQQEAVQVLQNAVANTDSAAMSHAWLITGPPGSGRSNAAVAFAAALQCPNGGCGTCQSCRTVLAGTHPDVTTVATQKVTISIDEVRKLLTVAAGAPSTGAWRIIIVEDADRMSERTSNVLLKSIEEPAARTVWLLCAPNPQDVILTIRSRCRALRLRIPPVQAVAQLLIDKDQVDPQLAHQVALAAQSHIGVARRLATNPEARAQRNQILELAGRIKGVGDAVVVAGELVDLATEQAKLSSSEQDAAEKAELLRVLGVGEERTLPPAVRAQVRQLEEDQKRRATRVQRDVLDRALLDILGLYRDVLVTQLGQVAQCFNQDQAGLIQRIAQATTPVESIHKLDAIGVARSRLGANCAPLLTLEALTVKLRVP